MFEMFHRIINTGFYGGISVLLDNLLSCSIFRCIAASRMLEVQSPTQTAFHGRCRIVPKCSSYILLKRNHLPRNLDLEPSSHCWSQQAWHKGLAFWVRSWSIAYYDRCYMIESDDFSHDTLPIPRLKFNTETEPFPTQGAKRLKLRWSGY